jgi:hypothetical protein
MVPRRHGRHDDGVHSSGGRPTMFPTRMTTAHDRTTTSDQRTTGDGSLATSGLRALRASTMIRMTADRLHAGYVRGMLDAREQAAVDRALATLDRTDAATASERVTAIVAVAVEDLADALDADDHVAGQFTVTFAGATLAASAIRSQLEVGALSPF